MMSLGRIMSLVRGDIIIVRTNGVIFSTDVVVVRADNVISTDDVSRKDGVIIIRGRPIS